MKISRKALKLRERKNKKDCMNYRKCHRLANDYFLEDRQHMIFNFL